MFELCVSERKVNITRNDILVSDSRNVYPVKFSFTAEWRGLTKTAVFRTVYNRKVEKTLEILLDDTNVCNIPWELLLKQDRILQVGAYGTKDEDLILNTIWCPLGQIYEGAKNVDADNHPGEPTPDVYQQILSQIGNLDELETDDKSSLVGAINEVYNSIGSGLGPDGPLPAGVASFNNRTGKVVPMAGDYTAEMVGATPAEDFTNFTTEFEEYKTQNEIDLDSKVDTTGGTITGPIMFSDSVSTTANEDVPDTVSKGVVVSSVGFYKDSDGPLNIYTNSGSVNFSANTVLTNVVGDESNPTSVPNMEQLSDTVDSIKSTIPTKVSQLDNDSNFATEKYVQDSISDIEGGEGVVGPPGPAGEDGKDGKDGDNGVTFIPFVSDDGIISWTNDGGLENPEPVDIMGPTGKQGPQGIQGEQGQQGIQGIQGVPGENGADGFSPTVSTQTNSNGDGTIITITDVNGEHTFEVLNGENGESGSVVELNAGDGITIDGDTISVTLPTKAVTQEEYDALSEAEKMADVEYIITDDESESGSTGGMSVPSGVIWPWYHEEETPVPDGWALCDGENGTPDLRGRFILGASESHSLGETGGSEKVTLTVEQMPSHSHKVGYQMLSNSKGNLSGTMLASLTSSTPARDSFSTGSSEPHPNMPPYFALDYIMKL